MRYEFLPNHICIIRSGQQIIHTNLPEKYRGTANCEIQIQLYFLLFHLQINYRKINPITRKAYKHLQILMTIKLWSKLLPARLACDLHARRVDSASRPLLHPLRLVNFLPGPLPHVPRACELRLRQLHLPPRHLPHTLRVRLLDRRQPDLLGRLPPHRLRAIGRRRTNDWPHTDRQLEV